eukprot:TRINITY_DN29983_c0_g1_i1.p1 TRINITY_DN29983_c0_g1~~TRINITY_DN29983_c0_g1_i1.p1  ORF type:complete len:166 (-),score=20.37 TRINITY_DN29983_c0_g1_i1:303-800(-)
MPATEHTRLLSRYFEYPLGKLMLGGSASSVMQTVGHIENGAKSGYWKHYEQKDDIPQIQPDHIQQLIRQQQDAVLVDVRGKIKQKSGQIEGAVNASMKQICMEPHKLLEDKEQPCILYCDTGIRAKIAGMALKNRGFTNVGYLVYNEFVRTGSPSLLMQAKSALH